ERGGKQDGCAVRRDAAADAVNGGSNDQTRRQTYGPVGGMIVVAALIVVCAVAFLIAGLARTRTNRARIAARLADSVDRLTLSTTESDEAEAQLRQRITTVGDALSRLERETETNGALEAAPALVLRRVRELRLGYEEHRREPRAIGSHNSFLSMRAPSQPS